MALKIFRVCLSSELPPERERQDNYIYLTYDTLTLYLGQNEFYDNFSVSESFPETPVNGMIYLLTSDGSVHRSIDYSDEKLADIEDESQIELLRGVGTTFSVNANRRYLDSQKRTIALPFNDGMYELAVSARNDLVVDNNTIVKYNEDTEKFEIYGGSGDDFIDYSKSIHGGTTPTVEMKVDGTRLNGNVRISKVHDNILRQTSDGLFAKVNDKADKADFDEFYSSYQEFKQHATDVLDNLSAEISAIEAVISEEKVYETIYEVLEEKFDDIQTYIDNYQAIYERMGELETELVYYATYNINAAKAEILATIEWDDMDDLYYHVDVDYYQKAKDYYTRPTPPEPGPTEEELEIILAAAIQMYLNDTN